MSRALRLAFMGSPDFVIPVLAALIEAGHTLACVYSPPPRPAGRGKKLRPTPVDEWARAHGLVVRTPRTLKAKAEQAAFAALNLDAAIVMAYGLILPQAMLSAPRFGCINLHASLLPRWRGAAPVHRAVMAGDQVTGIQAMIMEAGLDTGPVLATRKVDIASTDTTGSVLDRLAGQAPDLTLATLNGLMDGTVRARAQSDSGIVYADKITDKDQRIDWSCPASVVDCQIRGLSPHPGAWFLRLPGASGAPGAPSVRLKALMSRVEPGQPGAQSGQVLDERLLIQCGDRAAVRLLALQRPGARPVAASDFLHGFPVPAGERLG